MYVQTDIGNPAYVNSLSSLFLELFNFGNNAYCATWSGVGTTDSQLPYFAPLLQITQVGQPGFDYALEETPVLPANVWTPIAQAMNTTGTLVYRTTPSAPQQFYRSVSVAEANIPGMMAMPRSQGAPPVIMHSTAKARPAGTRPLMPKN